MRLAGTSRIAQPQQAWRLNWGHDLAEGLAFAFHGGVGLQDGVSGTMGVPSGTTVPVQKGAGGSFNGYDFTGTAYGASYIDFGSDSNLVSLATSSTTWAFLFYSITNTANMFAERNDGNTVSAGWGIESTTVGGSPMLVLERATANTKCDSNGGVVAGAWNTVVITTPGDGVGANVRFYVNGIARGPNVSVVGSGAQGVDTGKSLYLGRSVYVNKSHNGNIAVALIAKQVWGLVEAEAFHENPWALWTGPRFSMQGFTPPPGVPWRWFLAPEVLPW